ncbi:MAG: M43 family zinc metalloprotease [Bacteroidia bacterium]|nr:M43 family zinc metalloprotease [Bacteroidia bacterium]
MNFFGKLACISLCFAPFFTYSQSPYGICGTDILDKKLLEEQPQLIQQRELAEEIILQNITRLGQFRTNQRTTSGSDFVIPVVVHVIHTGTNDSISVAQVESQIEALNRDYRRIPGTIGFGAKGVDYKVEFSLATKDPNGNPTTGVNYLKNSTLANHSMDSEESALKSAIVWNQRKYLNIWVVRDITSSIAPQGGMILGYARFPQQITPSSTDGVVIRHDCFGTIGTAGGPGGDNIGGRTATHEVGHWLNLFHTFEGGCGTGNCTTSGDRICDTPPSGQANYGNPERLNTCDNDVPDLPDHTRNYMDYVSDMYMDMFTQGQKNRSHAVLTATFGGGGLYPQRYDLWQETNLQATGTGKYGAAKAIFTANNRFPCVGTPVQFEDYSTGQPHAWNWSFPGGTPSSSTDQNPVVTYSAPGNYAVTLTVTNQAGTSAPRTINAFIRVTDGAINPISATNNGLETFNSTTFPPTGWRLDNPDSANSQTGRTWRRTAAANATGSGATARMECYTYRSYGQRDGLVSPSYDYSQLPSSSPNLRPGFEFFRAYRRASFEYAGNPTLQVPPSYYLEYNDTLVGYYSTDCGNTWVEVYRKGGEDLQTAPIADVNSGGAFIPTSSQWAYEKVELPQLAGQPNVKYKLEVINGYGNHVYVDEFSPVILPTSNEKSWEESVSLTVVPNPFSSSTSVQLNLPTNQTIRYEVLDVQGKRILSNEMTLSAGKSNFELDLSSYSTGLYLLNVYYKDQVISKKLSFNR